MTLQEITERVGSKKIGIIRIYVNDALRELEGLIPERSTHTKYNIVSGTKFYDMPDDMVRLLGVYRRWSTNNTHYVKMGRATHINITEATTSSQAMGDVVAGEDIIVV